MIPVTAGWPTKRDKFLLRSCRCFHPAYQVKFDIDCYVYLKIPSTHAHFNIFHPGRWDGVFIFLARLPRSRKRLSRSRLAGQPVYPYEPITEFLIGR